MRKLYISKTDLFAKEEGILNMQHVVYEGDEAAERKQHRVSLTFLNEKLEQAYHSSRKEIYLHSLKWGILMAFMMELFNWIVEAILIWEFIPQGTQPVIVYVISSAMTIFIPMFLLLARIPKLQRWNDWIFLAVFVLLQGYTVYLGSTLSILLNHWGIVSFFRRALQHQLWLCFLASIGVKHVLLGIVIQFLSIFIGIFFWGLGNPLGESPLIGVGVAVSIFISGWWWFGIMYARSWIERRRFLLQKRSDAERRRIDFEKSLSQRLLLNIFPKVIIEKFKRDKATIVEEFSEVTIFFSDIASFTQMSSTKTPIQLVTLLNDLFSRFDEIVNKHKLEKIKTIGDAYMAVGGVPIATLDHAENTAMMALEVLEALNDFNKKNSKQLHGAFWNIRIGLHTGRVVAGVIGKKKYLYDIYGEAATVASKMEQTGSPGRVHVSEATYNLLKSSFQFEEAPSFMLGEKEMKTFWLIGKRNQIDDPNFVNEIIDNETINHAMTRIPALSLSIANPIWKHLNQEIEDLANIKLSKWTLSFPPVEIEREFRKYFAHWGFTRIRWICISLALFFLLLEGIEEAFSVDGIGKLVLRVLRYGVGIPGTITVLILSRTGAWERWGQKIQFVFCLLLVIGSLLVAGLHVLGMLATLVAVAITWGLPLRFPWALPLVLTGVVLSPVAWGVGWILSDSREGEWSSWLLIAIVALAAGSGRYSSEKILRRVFAEAKLVERQHERLLIERAKSEELLVNLLPVDIAQKLKESDQTIAERYPNVTIMFVHVLGLSELEGALELKELFKLANGIFCKFDDFTEVHKIEKIKTIGSSGLRDISDEDQIKAELIKVVKTGMDMMKHIDHLNRESQKSSTSLSLPVSITLGLRVGIHVGPIVAGVIGKKKFAYDIWGDAVNVASRMESTSTEKHIQVTDRIYELLKDEYQFEERGEMEIKGKGKMKTYFLNPGKLSV